MPENADTPKILVAGSANLDFVVRSQHIPMPGETVLGRNFRTFAGGKGANQAVACTRSGGAATAMLAAFGADDFAKPIKQSLADAGVQLHEIVSSQPTGVAFISVSDEGENAITVAPGANGDLQPQHWPLGINPIYLLMQLEIPVRTVMAYAKTAKARGTIVVLNAAPAQGLPEELLHCVEILVVNEVELTQLAGEGAVLDQLHRLASLGIKTVIVTLGAQGCMALHEGQILTQAGFKVQVLDTTGAGDTFCGTLVAALAQQRGRQFALQNAMRMACAASALACTRMGAQSSIPTHAEVMEFLAKQRD